MTSTTAAASRYRPPARRQRRGGAALPPVILLLFLLAAWRSSALASSGTEGASFLDIPVGARPAALGGAYSAVAGDAYAPAYNPSTLAFLQGPEAAGMHLAYVQDIAYEYLGYVHPLSNTAGIGGSIQYLLPGNISGLDYQARPTGDFNGHMASYNLAYGQRLGESLAIGATGKYIEESIDHVSAHAFAADAGAAYRLTPEIQLGAVVANVGQKLKFLNEGDPLPLQGRLGASYNSSRRWTAVAEGVYRNTQVIDARGGFELRSPEGHALRIGYSTDRIRHLSGFSGFSVGLGLALWRFRLDYTYSPIGLIGDTHYLSFVYRFGKEPPTGVLHPSESYLNLEEMDIQDAGFKTND